MTAEARAAAAVGLEMEVVAAQALKTMQEAVAKAMRRPAVAQRLSGDGAVAVTNTPDAFAKFLRADSDKWAKVIKRAKLTPETL